MKKKQQPTVLYAGPAKKWSEISEAERRAYAKATAAKMFTDAKAAKDAS